MAASFYIYYRVAADAHAAASERVGMLLERVRQESGAAGRLLIKRGQADLWMEVYESVPNEAAFAASLAAGVDALALEEVLTPGSTRRVECFED